MAAGWLSLGSTGVGEEETREVQRSIHNTLGWGKNTSQFQVYVVFHFVPAPLALT